jgi:uncharacterized protein (DUF697 family)
MNRKKKLPKAIVFPAAGRRDAPVDAGQRRESQPSASPAEASAAHAPGAHSPAALGNVIEMMPKADASSAATATTPNARAADDAEVAKRRRRARQIVERHANLSAIGGFIPVPVVNIAGITAVIVRMVRQLCRHYGVPFEGHRARAIVIALMGGTMPTGMATAATTTLIYFVPGYNVLGLAVSSVTASVTARSIGQLLVQHFEGGSTLAEFPALGGR